MSNLKIKSKIEKILEKCKKAAETATNDNCIVNQVDSNKSSPYIEIKNQCNKQKNPFKNNNYHYDSKYTSPSKNSLSYRIEGLEYSVDYDALNNKNQLNDISISIDTKLAKNYNKDTKNKKLDIKYYNNFVMKLSVLSVFKNNNISSKNSIDEIFCIECKIPIFLKNINESDKELVYHSFKAYTKSIIDNNLYTTFNNNQNTKEYYLKSYAHFEVNHSTVQKLNLVGNDFSALVNSKIEFTLHKVNNKVNNKKNHADLKTNVDYKELTYLANGFLNFDNVFLSEEYFYCDKIILYDNGNVNNKKSNNRLNSKSLSKNKKLASSKTLSNKIGLCSNNRLNNVITSDVPVAEIDISCQLFYNNNISNEKNLNKDHLFNNKKIYDLEEDESISTPKEPKPYNSYLNIKSNSKKELISRNDVDNNKNTVKNNKDAVNNLNNNIANLNDTQILYDNNVTYKEIKIDFEELLILYLNVGKLYPISSSSKSEKSPDIYNYFINHKTFPFQHTSQSDIMFGQEYPNFNYEYMMPFNVNQSSLKLLESGMFIVEIWNRIEGYDNLTGIVKLSLSCILETLMISYNCVSISPISKNKHPLILYEGKESVFSYETNSNIFYTDIILGCGTANQINNFSAKLKLKQFEAMNYNLKDKKIESNFDVENNINKENNNNNKKINNKLTINNLHDVNNIDRLSNKVDYSVDINKDDNKNYISDDEINNINYLMKDKINTNKNSVNNLNNSINNKNKNMENEKVNFYNNPFDSKKFVISNLTIENKESMSIYPLVVVNTNNQSFNLNNNKQTKISNKNVDFSIPDAVFSELRDYGESKLKNKSNKIVNNSLRGGCNNLLKEFNDNELLDNKFTKNDEFKEKDDQLKRKQREIKEAEDKLIEQTNKMLGDNSYKDPYLVEKIYTKKSKDSNLNENKIITNLSLINSNKNKSNCNEITRTEVFINKQSREICNNSFNSNKKNNFIEEIIKIENKDIIEKKENLNKNINYIKHTFKFIFEEVKNLSLINKLNDLYFEYTFLKETIKTDIINNSSIMYDNTNSVICNLNYCFDHELILTPQDSILKNIGNQVDFEIKLKTKDNEIGYTKLSIESIKELINNTNQNDSNNITNYLFIFATSAKLKLSLYYNNTHIYNIDCNKDELHNKDIKNTELSTNLNEINTNDLILEKTIIYNKKINQYSKLKISLKYFTSEKNLINILNNINELTYYMDFNLFYDDMNNFKNTYHIHRSKFVSRCLTTFFKNEEYSIILDMFDSNIINYFKNNNLVVCFYLKNYNYDRNSNKHDKNIDTHNYFDKDYNYNVEKDNLNTNLDNLYKNEHFDINLEYLSNQVNIDNTKYNIKNSDLYNSLNEFDNLKFYFEKQKIIPLNNFEYLAIGRVSLDQLLTTNSSNIKCNIPLIIDNNSEFANIKTKNMLLNSNSIGYINLEMQLEESSKEEYNAYNISSIDNKENNFIKDLNNYNSNILTNKGKLEINNAYYSNCNIYNIIKELENRYNYSKTHIPLKSTVNLKEVLIPCNSLQINCNNNQTFENNQIQNIDTIKNELINNNYQLIINLRDIIYDNASINKLLLEITNEFYELETEDISFFLSINFSKSEYNHPFIGNSKVLTHTINNSETFKIPLDLNNIITNKKDKFNSVIFENNNFISTLKSIEFFKLEFINLNFKELKDKNNLEAENLINWLIESILEIKFFVQLPGYVNLNKEYSNSIIDNNKDNFSNKINISNPQSIQLGSFMINLSSILYCKINNLCYFSDFFNCKLYIPKKRIDDSSIKLVSSVLMINVTKFNHSISNFNTCLKSSFLNFREKFNFRSLFNDNKEIDLYNLSFVEAIIGKENFLFICNYIIDLKELKNCYINNNKLNSFISNKENELDNSCLINKINALFKIFCGVEINSNLINLLLTKENSNISNNNININNKSDTYLVIEKISFIFKQLNDSFDNSTLKIENNSNFDSNKTYLDNFNKTTQFKKEELEVTSKKLNKKQIISTIYSIFNKDFDITMIETLVKYTFEYNKLKRDNSNNNSFDIYDFEFKENGDSSCNTISIIDFVYILYSLCNNIGDIKFAELKTNYNNTINTDYKVKEISNLYNSLEKNELNIDKNINNNASNKINKLTNLNSEPSFRLFIISANNLNIIDTDMLLNYLLEYSNTVNNKTLLSNPFTSFKNNIKPNPYFTLNSLKNTLLYRSDYILKTSYPCWESSLLISSKDIINNNIESYDNNNIDNQIYDSLYIKLDLYSKISESSFLDDIYLGYVNLNIKDILDFSNDNGDYHFEYDVLYHYSLNNINYVFSNGIVSIKAKLLSCMKHKFISLINKLKLSIIEEKKKNFLYKTNNSKKSILIDTKLNNNINNNLSINNLKENNEDKVKEYLENLTKETNNKVDLNEDTNCMWNNLEKENNVTLNLLLL